jgi:hypothetical protein
MQLKPTTLALQHFPWLRVSDGDGAWSSLVPPIGRIAGPVAQNDHSAGTHFAPIDLRISGTSVGYDRPSNAL